MIKDEKGLRPLREVKGKTAVLFRGRRPAAQNTGDWY